MSDEQTNYDRMKAKYLNNKIFGYAALLAVATIALTTLFEGVITALKETGYIQTTYTDLRIVDIDTTQRNRIEFKIKNSGNDAAFLKSIEFVLGDVTYICANCFPSKPTEYYFNVLVDAQSESIQPQYVDKATGDLLPIPNPQEEKVRYDLLARESFSGQRNELIIGKQSAPLPISQVVPPNGTDHFAVTIIEDNLDTNGYLVFGATAIIRYDEDKQIATPPINLEIHNKAYTGVDTSPGPSFELLLQELQQNRDERIANDNDDTQSPQVDVFGEFLRKSGIEQEDIN